MAIGIARSGRTSCLICSPVLPQLQGKISDVLRVDEDVLDSVMRRDHEISFARIVSAGLLGTFTAFGLHGAGLAAGPCIEGPNLDTSQGRHWYYRVDRTNHRKCWYARETGLKTTADAPLEPTLFPGSPPNWTVFTLFTSLGTGLPGPASAGTQPSTTPELRVRPIVPRDTPKAVHAVANEHSRRAQRTDSKVAATTERTTQPASRASAEHTDQVNSQAIDQETQAALFLEFLRWKELQKSVK